MNGQASSVIATVPVDSGTARRVYADTRYEISILTAAEDVRALQSHSGALLRRPLEANVFYEPWMLAAAMSTLTKESVQVVTIRERASGEVTGIVPLQLAAKFRGLPIRVLRSWRHLHCFLCTPLISQLHAHATVRCFLDWLESSSAPAHILELELYSADGAFETVLQSELTARSRWRSILHTRERAVLRPRANPVFGLSGRHLRELRRQERKLGELGPCAFRVYESTDEIRDGLDQFLRLEASGWKGREHTALASDIDSREFFLRIAREAMAQGRLRLVALESRGVPIAMICDFLAGSGAFGFKIAYDERYAKYSPGLLLQQFNVGQWAADRRSIEWVDSCAEPDHPVMNRVWSERRTLADRVMSPRPMAGLLLDHWEHLARARALVRRYVDRLRRIQPGPVSAP
jgi:CelD/BcsL family acetyltransferase involved in cellulose biosynthesis